MEYSSTSENSRIFPKNSAKWSGVSQVEVLWWRAQKKMGPIGDFGGIVLSLDKALEYVMDDPTEFLWPY